MMNRQQVAIAIAKINKTSKLLRYWQELKPETYVTALDSDLVHFGKWSHDIGEYLMEHPNKKLYYMLWVMGPTDNLKDYVRIYQNTMPSEVRLSLLDFIANMKKISDDSKEIQSRAKGEYRYLADGLDNKEAAELLDRARNMRILDDKYQPMPDISRGQLKVIAFAVSHLLGFKFRHKWTAFAKQWQSEIDHVSNADLPNRNRADMKLITDLYPEVDFDNLFICPRDDYFNTSFSWGKIKSLFYTLKKNGYIDESTTLVNFNALFKPANKKGRIPVNWLKDEHALSLLVYALFKPDNKIMIWSTAENCFTVKGRRPNRRTLAMFLTKIKKRTETHSLRNEDVKLLKVLRGYLIRNSYFCNR